VQTSTAEPCPLGTYSSQTRLTTATSCTDCPAGYFCNKTAISNYKLYPCPKGRYCTARSLSPINCPAGTYKNTTGARQEADCYACPPGFYCPEGTIQPVPCRGATDCPLSSKFYTTCPGGSYCNAANNFQATVCPMNYYCPRGTQNPIPCTGRLLCDEGSEVPDLCGAGNIVVQGDDGFINTCQMCPQGTYSTL